jgi:hypothetical protein
MLRRLATRLEQFLNQGGARFYIMPGAALCPLDAVLLRRDPQFVALDPQHNFISDLDAKGFTECCWDNNAAIFVHACACFHFHVTLQD